MDVQQWAKTADGRNQIETQKPFCIGGFLYQGFNGAPIPVQESQLSDAEMKALLDVDGTMERQWFVRRQRAEARLAEKMKEYDKRRRDLRVERNAIRESIKADKELGLSANPSDLEDIRRIDSRMKRLSDLTREREAETAIAWHEAGGRDPEKVKAEAVPAHGVSGKPAEPPPRVQCATCSAMSPQAHRNPEMWLRGHQIQHVQTTKRRGRPPKVREAVG